MYFKHKCKGYEGGGGIMGESLSEKRVEFTNDSFVLLIFFIYIFN
jgi:hypothetical protein